MFSADGLVGLVASDLDLSSLFDNSAVSIESEHHGRLAAAVADCLDFDEVVGPGEQVSAAFKELSLEVGSESVTEDGYAEVVGDVSELLHLFTAEELSFVDQQAVQWLCGDGLFDEGEQVVGGGEGCGFGGESDAR